MQPKFKFQNFKPCVATCDHASVLFEKVWRASPSDSSVSAAVTRSVDQLYHTVIEVSSSVGSFRAEAMDRIASVSVGLATDLIQRSLREWILERQSGE